MINGVGAHVMLLSSSAISKVLVVNQGVENARGMMVESGAIQEEFGRA